MSSIAENLATIRRNLGGRSVTVVGVTKKQSLDHIRAAVDAGLEDFGNNYAQEGESLRESIETGRWHFIGHIQSRKVKELLEYDLIQSLDRLEIVEAFHRRLEPLNRSIDGLVEINIGGEPSKSGIAPADLPALLQAARAFPRVRLRGLMIMPPPLEPIEARREFFRRAKALFDAHDAPSWDTLSMGTSDDYRLAVEEGSTMVRLGTVLFGPRT
jgi:PLP dependent protein